MTEGNPLPQISWSVNGNINAASRQSVTGFLETASSTLTVSVGELNLGVNTVVCTAAVDAVSPALTETSTGIVRIEGMTNSYWVTIL